MNSSISELHFLTDTDKKIRINERMLDWHLSTEANWNWRAALDDKWRLASLAQRGIQ